MPTAAVSYTICGLQASQLMTILFFEWAVTDQHWCLCTAPFIFVISL